MIKTGTNISINKLTGTIIAIIHELKLVLPFMIELVSFAVVLDVGYVGGVTIG